MAVLGLCFVFLAIYIVLAIIFAACTTIVAAQAVQAIWASAIIPESISLAGTFAVGLCFWIPFILYCCRHLLLLYMQIVTPIIAAVLVCAGEITMPTYMSLWSMLISYQVCSLVMSGSCTIPLISRIARTIAMTIMGLELLCPCPYGAFYWYVPIRPFVVWGLYCLLSHTRGLSRKIIRCDDGVYYSTAVKTIGLFFCALHGCSKPAHYISRSFSYAFALCRSSLLHHL